MSMARSLGLQHHGAGVRIGQRELFVGLRLHLLAHAVHTTLLGAQRPCAATEPPEAPNSISGSIRSAVGYVTTEKRRRMKTIQKFWNRNALARIRWMGRELSGRGSSTARVSFRAGGER
jgi:hypothetical protein